MIIAFMGKQRLLKIVIANSTKQNLTIETNVEYTLILANSKVRVLKTLTKPVKYQPLYGQVIYPSIEYPGHLLISYDVSNV